MLPFSMLVGIGEKLTICLGKDLCCFEITLFQEKGLAKKEQCNSWVPSG
jgi:hypothetical protein